MLITVHIGKCLYNARVMNETPSRLISPQELLQRIPLSWLGFEVYALPDLGLIVFGAQLPISPSESHPAGMAAFTPGIARVDTASDTHHFSGLHKTPEVIPGVKRAYFDDAYYPSNGDLFPKRVQVEARRGASLICIVSPGDVEVRPRGAQESRHMPGIHIYVLSPMEAGIRPFNLYEVQGARTLFTWE